MSVHWEIGDEGQLRSTLRRVLGGLLRQRLETRERVSWGVPGGSALRLVEGLEPSDWAFDRTDVILIDERAVPPDHEESNLRAVRRVLPEELRVAPFYVTERGLEGSRDDYAELLGSFGRELDAVLVGVGPDGHIASLFPGRPELEADSERALVVRDSPKPPPERLSLSLPVIAGAGLVVVAALGQEKAEVMARVLSQGDTELPLARLVRRAARVEVLLDPAAASLLPR